MGLLRRIFEGKAVKDGIRGEALVLAIHAPTAAASRHQMSAELLVRAPHLPPYEVSRTLYVKEAKWPMPGMSVPVMVDREDKDHLQILWDDIAGRNREEMQAALSEQLRAGRIRARHSVESEVNPDDPPELYRLFDDRSDSPPNTMVELVDRPPA